MPIDSHIRPVELRKDLAAIADLIDICFSENMDPEGKDYLRHIRQIAFSMGSFLVEGTTPENSQLPFQGYVWEEGGKLIGNLTLIQVRKRDRHTYLIANVAVHPNQRGRGIARQLTDRALLHVREHDGTKIFLQVRDDNPTAIHIYQESGFQEDNRRTTWSYEPGSARRGERCDYQVSGRRSEDWDAQRAWLQETYPAGISWNMPFNLDRLAPGFWRWLNVFLQGGYGRSWSVREKEQLLGVGTWEKGFSVTDYLWIGADPNKESEAIRTLIPAAANGLLRLSKFQVNYPAGRGVEAFQDSGMKLVHTLLWMSKSFTNSSEDLPGS